MNGDGFGSPPWGPADPVPELEDTQALPGLGQIPGPGQPSGPAQFGAGNHRDEYPGDVFRSTGTPRDTAANRRAPHGPARSGPGPDRTGADAATGDEPAAGNDGNGKEGDEPRRFRRRRRSFLRELPVLVIVALVLALVIKAFAIQAFWIPSGSMQNTLAVNDRVLVNKIVYHLRPIHRGDIVVFDGTGSWDFDNPPSNSNIFAKGLDQVEGLFGISHDSSIYIKRVIGLPGDHVVCCNASGQITVNGVALSESSYLYPDNKPSVTKFSITVPAGRLWVMGDHRLISDDSRGHIGDPGGGTIPESGVIGRAFVIIWPPSQWGFLNIPATFEQPQLNASNPAAGGGNPAALESAMANGTPIRQTTSPIPLALGFIGAIPVTWLQRKARRHLKRRRAKT
jgi:signal peptidase I